jgi:hypothetical protein
VLGPVGGPTPGRPHRRPAQPTSPRHGQPGGRMHLPPLACRALLRWRCVNRWRPICVLLQQRCGSDQINAPLPHSVVSEQLMIWALPDFKVASSCGTGALLGSSCFCLFRSACICHLEWTRLTCCCRTSRPGSNECFRNLLHAACVLHYHVHFLPAEKSYSSLTVWEDRRTRIQVVPRAESGSRHSHVIIIGGKF